MEGKGGLGELVMERRLAEAGAQMDAALSKLTVHGDPLRDEVRRLSSDWSVSCVQLQTIPCQLRAARTEAGTVSGLFTI